MSDVPKVPNRRRRKPTERLQLWINIAATTLLGVPMILTEIKPLLLEHHYGVVSSVVASLNLIIGAYRLHAYRTGFPADRLDDIPTLNERSS